MEKKKILKTSTTEWVGEEVLLCPICGEPFIHPLSVSVAKGHETFHIRHEGAVVTQEETPLSRKAIAERGVRIALEYHCEMGHHGFLIFQFHKGETLIEHKEALPLADWKTLWRD